MAYTNWQTSSQNMAKSKEDNKKNDWQKAMESMSMMALAKGATPDTMLGFALGKALSKFLFPEEKIMNKKTKGSDTGTLSMANPTGNNEGMGLLSGNSTDRVPTLQTTDNMIAILGNPDALRKNIPSETLTGGI